MEKLVLKVTSDVTLSQINADAVFDTSHDVGGVGNNPAILDTVITFHDGSSLTLWDANIASFSAANTVLAH